MNGGHPLVRAGVVGSSDEHSARQCRWRSSASWCGSASWARSSCTGDTGKCRLRSPADARHRLDRRHAAHGPAAADRTGTAPVFLEIHHAD